MNIQNSRSFPYLDNRLNTFTNEFRFNYSVIQYPQFRDVKKINFIGDNFFIKQYYNHAKACYEKSLTIDSNQAEPLLNYAEIVYLEYMQDKNIIKNKYMNGFKKILNHISNDRSSKFHQLKVNNIIKKIDGYLNGNDNKYSFIEVISDIQKLFQNISFSNDAVFVDHYRCIDGVLTLMSHSRVEELDKWKKNFQSMQEQLKEDLRALEKKEMFIRNFVNKAMNLKINFSDFINESQVGV